jgi:transposase InsO family protein
LTVAGLIIAGLCLFHGEAKTWHGLARAVPPDHLHSYNGTEFTAIAVRGPLRAWQAWENGYNESFNGKLRDELLGRESSIPWGRLGC